jgi:hypothetical protein
MVLTFREYEFLHSLIEPSLGRTGTVVEKVKILHALEACILLHMFYSLRSIILFININISTTKICLDTSILMKSIMSRRE